MGPHRKLPIDDRTKWRINVEMPRAMYEALEAEAASQHGPVSVLVRQIIDAHFRASTQSARRAS